MTEEDLFTFGGIDSPSFQLAGYIEVQLHEMAKPVEDNVGRWALDDTKMCEVIAEQLVANHVVRFDKGAVRLRTGVGKYRPCSLASGTKEDPALHSEIIAEARKASEYALKHLGKKDGCRMVEVEEVVTTGTGKDKAPALDDDGKPRKKMSMKKSAEWEGSVKDWREFKFAMVGRIAAGVRRQLGQLASRSGDHLAPVTWPVEVPFDDVIYGVGDKSHVMDLANAGTLVMADSIYLEDGSQRWHYVRTYVEEDTVYRYAPHDLMAMVSDDYVPETVQELIPFTRNLRSVDDIDSDGTVDGLPVDMTELDDGRKLYSVTSEIVFEYDRLPHLSEPGQPLHGRYGEAFDRYFRGDEYVGDDGQTHATYDTRELFFDMLAEGFVRRTKHYALMLCSRPGTGKTVMVDVLRAIYGTYAVGTTMGAETRDVAIMFGDKEEHATANDIYNGTSVVFGSDLGTRFTLGDRLTKIVASSGGVSQRGMHEDFSNSLDITATVIFEVNGTAGLTGYSEQGAQPDERRVLQVMFPPLIHKDILFLTSEKPLLGSGQPSEDAALLFWFLLSRIGKDQLIYSRNGYQERAPFREAIDDGFFSERELDSNYYKSLGLQKCEWGFDEDGNPFGMIAVSELTSVVVKSTGVVPRNGAFADFFRAESMFAESNNVMLRDVPTWGTYRKKSRLKKTHIAVGWESTIYGKSVDIGNRCNPAKIRDALAAIEVEQDV